MCSDRCPVRGALLVLVRPVAVLAGDFGTSTFVQLDRMVISVY
jgi:hypothetical protein